MTRFIRVLSLAALLFLPSIAHAAGEVDYLVKCATEATCEADSVLGKYYLLPASDDQPGQWNGVWCFPANVYQNGVQADGFFLWISLTKADPDLDSSPALIISADRDKALAGDPTFIRFTPIPADQLSSYTISPVVAGSKYPFGAAP